MRIKAVSTCAEDRRRGDRVEMIKKLHQFYNLNKLQIVKKKGDFKKGKLVKSK